MTDVQVSLKLSHFSTKPIDVVVSKSQEEICIMLLNTGFQLYSETLSRAIHVNKFFLFLFLV